MDLRTLDKIIPHDLLEKIDQYTSGGFMSFLVDKQGEIVYIPYFSNQAMAKGVIKTANDITEALLTQQRINIFKDLQVGIDMEEDEEDV